jgi:hypothetical protein
MSKVNNINTKYNFINNEGSSPPKNSLKNSMTSEDELVPPVCHQQPYIYNLEHQNLNVASASNLN